MSQRKKRRKNGQFAKATSSAKRSAPRRTSSRKRRRANPTLPVMLANPHQGGRRTSRRKRRRASRSAVTGHRTSARHRANPHRRRRRGALVHHKGHKMSMRRRRRANPIMGFSLGAVIRTGIFGGAGIVSARIFGALYTSYLSDTVRGDEGKADATNWRNYLDEFLRLVAMEVGPILVDRALLKRMAKPSDRMAYLVGATAETVRQGVGVVVHAVSPSTDRKRIGLDGMYDDGSASIPQGYETPDGRIFVLNDRGTGYVQVPPMALQGLAYRNDFPPSGMAGPVMARDAFRGQ